MSIALARQIARALDIRSESKIRALNEGLLGYVRLTQQSPVTAVPGSIDASQVVSGTFADARVAESNVTQHEAALELDALQVSSGSFADARIQASNVTQHQAALAITESQISDLGTTVASLVTGTWTPADNSGAALTLTNADGDYTQLGNVMIARARITYPATADGSGVELSGLPATCANKASARQGFVSFLNLGGAAYVIPLANTARFRLYDSATTQLVNSQLSGKSFFVTLLYEVA